MPVVEFFVIVKIVVVDFSCAGVFGFADEIEAGFFGQHLADGLKVAGVETVNVAR